MEDNLSIKIKPLCGDNHDIWNKFLLNVPESTYYCTTDYWSAFNDSYLLMVFDLSGELIVEIPFRLQSLVQLVGR